VVLERRLRAGGASLPLFDRYLVDQHALAGVGAAAVRLGRPPRPADTVARGRGQT
jgi:hypothetical protein